MPNFIGMHIFSKEISEKKARATVSCETVARWESATVLVLVVVLVVVLVLILVLALILILVLILVIHN